ncbi:hypothetical protein GCM10011511_05900 [Puia dinghuensis]|uniref:Bacterial surface antigen (D15) domain-containing protein n=1 Tax=Puia dinghuensis TaxID=1792502 RepID=A0A8J2XQP1_9BACT|nr:hypothetical protein GCM10011511_05900 [Puia dinghuensis]
MSTGIYAQVFGGNPPSLKWQQLNTDTARIIFPTGLDSQAQFVAGIVHRLARTTRSTIGPHQRKINVVLQNQTTIANGYVSLAPFRSEFQLTPEQNSFELGSLPWAKMLAIHEYRHVQQYNNFRVGLSGGFYYLFGEGGQAFANSLSVPNWFWEGDAVYQETLVSDQGRGRQPWFFNSYRALWAGDKRYSWMKLRNGSFRDYVPDHYPLGYMLIAYGRERYGDDFWRKVGRDAAAFHGLFYPLQGAVRRYAGVSFNQFRRDAFDYFCLPLQPPAGTAIPTVEAFARARKHFFANEEFPQFLGTDSILYMRSSYKRIPAFVIRDLGSGAETRLRTRSISLDNYFSYRNGRIVYSAYETDPRWGWRDYGVIRLLNLATGEDKRLTVRSRYFAPDISEDGRTIVAVQEATDGSCQLHLLNATDGSLMRPIPNPDGLFYTYPKFYTGDNAIITAVRNRSGEMSLALVDLHDGGTRYLLPFSYQTIGFPSVRADTIWFTASRNDQDRVYGLAGGQLFRVWLPHGDPRTGQYQFQEGPGGQATWNTFTAVGFLADTAGSGSFRLQPIAEGDWVKAPPVQRIDSLEKGPAGLLGHIAPGHYPATTYPLASHLINFHSWRPYINDPDYQLSLVSDNILNTLETQVYGVYNRNEQYKQVGVEATYGGLYPFLDAGWDYTFDRNAFYRIQKVFWNESETRAGFSVPLNWASHLHFTSLQFGSNIIYNQRHYTGLYKDSFNSRGFAYVDPYISFVHQSQQAQQQVAPRMAQILNLSYSNAVTAFEAHQFLASGFLYLPGLAYTHSLLLAAAFQQRDRLGNARFSNNFPFSRGYSAENFYRMWRVSANYQLPLFYPDWGFGNMVYFTRIRANLFYDHTHAMDFYINGATYNGMFRSFGSEVYFDTKWWNQLSLSFGIRYSHLLDPDFEGRGSDQWELILPLNILSQGYSGHAVKPID